MSLVNSTRMKLDLLFSIFSMSESKGVSQISESEVVLFLPFMRLFTTLLSRSYPAKPEIELGSALIWLKFSFVMF